MKKRLVHKTFDVIQGIVQSENKYVSPQPVNLEESY